jgi:hypothetical protein
MTSSRRLCRFSRLSYARCALDPDLFRTEHPGSGRRRQGAKDWIGAFRLKTGKSVRRFNLIPDDREPGANAGVLYVPVGILGSIHWVATLSAVGGSDIERLGERILALAWQESVSAIITLAQGA